MLQELDPNLQSQWKTFFAFCIYFASTPVPVSVDMLSLYIQFLSRSFQCVQSTKNSRRFQCVQSIKNYVNGMRLLHLFKAVTYPYIERFELNMEYRRMDRLIIHVRQVLPTTPEILYAIFDQTDFQSPFDATLWCCFLLAFFLFACKSNMVPPVLESLISKNICNEMISSLGVNSLLVTLKWSKTIQYDE